MSQEKKKKSRRHSGGIIVYYKKTISRGVTYVNYGSKSENRLWLKLDKSFFDFEHDLYLCAVYIPPVTSVHYDNIFANQGKVLLIGDFNSRTGQSPDYILNDSTDLKIFQIIIFFLEIIQWIKYLKEITKIISVIHKERTFYICA